MSKIKDGIVGHAIGDAMGVPIEFCDRKYLKKHPISEMVGYGSHNVPAGCFSDDTSMLLATLYSYNHKNCWDYEDVMKQFALWYKEAHFTATDKVFDIGNTCYRAISSYLRYHTNPLECGLKDEYSNGNGSLMRILPVAYYAYYKQLNSDEIYLYVKDLSSLTHGHEISILGCYIYVQYALCLLKGMDKKESYAYLQSCDYSYFTKASLAKYERILKEDISSIPVHKISARGYVISTLEAVLYSFLTTDSFRDAILVSIHLGDDTDTVGAICGGIAGIYYGMENIPEMWLNGLLRKDYIEGICEEFENAVKREMV